MDVDVDGTGALLYAVSRDMRGSDFLEKMPPVPARDLEEAVAEYRAIVEEMEGYSEGTVIETLQTLADRSRRELFEEIRVNPQSHDELFRRSSYVSGPPVTRGVKDLRDAGLVAVREQGRTKSYEWTETGESAYELIRTVEWVADKYSDEVRTLFVS